VNEWLQWLALLAAWLLAVYAIGWLHTRQAVFAAAACLPLLLAADPSRWELVGLFFTAIPLGLWVDDQRKPRLVVA
jgi:hypothetical protein